MKIAWLSDMDLTGSGYLNLSVPLCTGLVERGHEVKVAGLRYSGNEHNYPFSIIPAQTLQESAGVIQNLYNVWLFDVLIVALDIPVQAKVLQFAQQRPFKYVGIMPVEAPPLSMSWAMILGQMDKPLIITQFGADEAQKAGIASAEHIQIGIDTESWIMPTADEKKKLRKALGIDDSFCILTVADNQERKNLAASLEAFADFSRDKDDVKYLLVTREHNPVGWTLRDYALELGINNSKLLIFERGMSFKELWSLYAASDCFMLTSKAEGLGMPVLESMAVGLPSIGTRCTGMEELLGDNRGILVDYEYTHRDPFGNAFRYWVDKDKVSMSLEHLYHFHGNDEFKYMTQIARNYVEERTWDKAVDTLENSLKEVVDENNSDSQNQE